MTDEEERWLAVDEDEQSRGVRGHPIFVITQGGRDIKIYANGMVEGLEGVTAIENHIAYLLGAPGVDRNLLRYFSSKPSSHPKSPPQSTSESLAFGSSTQT